MRNAGSRRVKIDAVFARERLDLRILRQIFGGSVLDVVIDGEDWLCRIGNRCRADLSKFRNHRAGIVMRHYVARANRNKVAAAHRRAGSKPIRMASGDLLNEGQTHILINEKEREAPVNFLLSLIYGDSRWQKCCNCRSCVSAIVTGCQRY